MLLIGGAVLVALVIGAVVHDTQAVPGACFEDNSDGRAGRTFESLLTRADTAMAAGALVAPPGQNAADLYKQALHRNGSDPRPLPASRK